MIKEIGLILSVLIVIIAEVKFHRNKHRKTIMVIADECAKNIEEITDRVNKNGGKLKNGHKKEVSNNVRYNT